MILRALKLPFFAGILILLLVSGILRADNSTNATYGFYSETYAGLNYDSTLPTDTDRGFMMQWGNGGGTFADDLYYTEGTMALGFSTMGINGWGGFEMCFGDKWTPSDRDFSYYKGGTIEFDIMLNMTYPFYTRPTDVQFQLQWNTTGGAAVTSDVITLGSYIAANGNWQHCSIPFTVFKNTPNSWNFVNQPGGNDGIRHFDGMIFNVGISSAEFFIDNLVWKSPNTGSMSVSLTNRFSGVAASSFTWSGVNLGTTKWKAADQYIQMQTDYYDLPGGSKWGVQIYTDNKNGGASPKYTGTGNPVGLVNATTTTVTLPMAWRCVDITTTSVSVQQGAPGFPDRLWVSEISNQFPCFLWMEDSHTAGFANASDYVTVQDVRGIQYAEASWGGAMPPNYLYIAANFANATTPNTYMTNKLILELFHE